MADFDSRIDALKAFAEGKTAIVGMTTSGSFNVLGNDGRCSIIGKEIGFENIGVDANIDTSTHGNEASFEFIVDKNPDYIFAMDRDAAIGTDGAQLAQEILENELVEEHRCLQEWPHRLSGTPECLVHRRGRHSGTERNAERSGKRTAVIFSKFFLQF